MSNGSKLKGKATPASPIGTRVFHPIRENIAFGRMALPVLTQQIQNPDVELRQRAVQTLCDHLFDPKNVALSAFSDLVPQLKNLVSDDNSQVRVKAAECFSATTSSPIGRKAFLQYGLYRETMRLLDDPDEFVRKAANVVLQRTSLSPDGVESLVAAGVIPKLLNRVLNEPLYIQVTILDTLHSCCLIDAEQALLYGGMEIIAELLGNPSPILREKATIIVADMSVEAKGRNKAFEVGALGPLIDLCSDLNCKVRAKSLAALMMIANATPARIVSIEKNAIAKILPLLKDENHEIRLNCLKVLTALAEAPVGRRILLDCLNEIMPVTYDPSAQIRKAATTAVSVISAQP